MVIFRELDMFIHSFASEAREKKIDLFGIEEIPNTGMSEGIDVFDITRGIPNGGPKMDNAQNHNQKSSQTKKRKISNGVQKIDRHQKRRDPSSARRCQLDTTRRRKRRRFLIKAAANDAFDGGHLEPLDILADLGFDVSETREKKKKKKRGTSVVPQLPRDVVFELLTRLPIKKLFQCTCVSKVWDSIIRDNRFAEAYRIRNPLSLVLSIPHNRLGRDRVPPRICSSSFGDSESVNLFDVSIFNHSFLDSRLGVTQVINGLFCYYSRCLVFLANVFTHETMKLPLPAGLKSSISPQYYFGFDAVSGEYKLLSISSRGHLRHRRVKILTIGRDSSWRELGNGDAIPAFEGQSSFVNGALHWLHLLNINDGLRAYSFDLTTEKFSSVPIREFSFWFDTALLTRGCFVQYRGRLALCGRNNLDLLIIYILEDDQKWNRHWLYVPEEFFNDKHVPNTGVGNMPAAGEIFFVDHETGPVAPVYAIEHTLNRFVVGLLPRLDADILCHAVVNVAFVQQNIATLDALISSGGGTIK